MRHTTRAREVPAKQPAAKPAAKPRLTQLEKTSIAIEAGRHLTAAAQQLALIKAKPNKTIPAGASDSDVEAKIIESLGDPTHRPLTIEQRCELIGIGRSTFYRHMQNPSFHARASRAWRECCREQLGAVYEVLIASALIPGRDGHRDRKLLLEVLGEVAEGRGIAGSADVSKDGREMTDDELLAAFEGREELLPPGVLRRLGKDPDAAADVKPKSKPGKEAQPNAKAREAPKADKTRRAR